MISETGIFKFGTNMITKLFNKLNQISKSRADEIENITRQFGDPFELTKYYIEPYCQQFNPADEDDESYNLVRENVTSRIQHFISSQNKTSSNHLFVLADAGMGKTSLLVLLKLTHLCSFWPKDYDCQLFKLGNTTFSDIEKLDRSKTVLLLDALDEDPNSWSDTTKRLTDILHLTKNFYRVIISCRTQFFSGGTDPFNRRGQVEVGGYICPTIYISLFDSFQVQEYLNKRFKNERVLQKDAWDLLKKIHSLKFRPMILANIDALVESDFEIKNEYTLYNALINAWLLREFRKREPNSKNNIPTVAELEDACIKLSKVLTMSGEKSVSLDFISNWLKLTHVSSIIKEMDIGGRSLLNKNSENEFRFSHYSIQEFLFSKGVIEKIIDTRNITDIKATHLMFQFALQAIYEIGIKSINTNYNLGFMNFNSMHFQNLNFRQIPINFNGSNMSDSKFTKCNFDLKKFEDVNFSGSKFHKCDIEPFKNSHSSLAECSIYDCELPKTITSDIFWDNTSFRDCNLTNTTINNLELKKSTFLKTYFNSCKLINYKVRNLILNGCIFDIVIFNKVESDILTGTHLYINNAKIANTKFKYFKFKHIEIYKTIILDTNFTGGSYSSAFIYQSELINCKFENIDFSNINFKRIKISNCSFKHCSFTSIQVKLLKKSGNNLLIE